MPLVVCCREREYTELGDILRLHGAVVVQPLTDEQVQAYLDRGGERLPGVQRLKSPLEGFSPGVHLRGRCHGDRLGGRPARSVLSGAVSTARLSLLTLFIHFSVHFPQWQCCHNLPGYLAQYVAIGG